MNSLMSILMSASSLPNMNSASALASSVFPTPVGPRKMNEPIGRFGILEAGPRPADGLRDDPDRLLLADDPAVERLLHVEQALRLLLGDAGDRDARSTSRRPGRSPPRRPSAGRPRPATAIRRAGRRPLSRAVASASRSVAASSYSWLLIAASFSLVIRSRSFCASRRAGGAEAWRRRTREAASSIRSIALSGRWRSVM